MAGGLEKQFGAKNGSPTDWCWKIGRQT